MTPERRPRLIGAGPVQREWMDLGACQGADVEDWFPDQGNNGTRAREICGGCPVRLQCLEYALENHERYGIWGGLDREERRAILRRRRRVS